jgi:hypothetical protein
VVEGIGERDLGRGGVAMGTKTIRPQSLDLGLKERGDHGMPYWCHPEEMDNEIESAIIRFVLG